MTSETTSPTSTNADDDSLDAAGTPAPDPPLVDDLDAHEDEPTDAGDDEAPDDGADPVAAARHEAKRWRLRLREVEAERDRALEQLEAYRRREAEQLAGAHLQDGADLWAADVQLADLLDDAGELDARKLHDAVDRVLEQRPHWRRRLSPGTADGGPRGSAPLAPPSMASALRGRGQG